MSNGLRTVLIAEVSRMLSCGTFPGKTAYQFGHCIIGISVPVPRTGLDARRLYSMRCSVRLELAAHRALLIAHSSPSPLTAQRFTSGFHGFGLAGALGFTPKSHT